MRRLLKFTYSEKDGVLVNYEREIPGRARPETITIESSEKPLPDLLSALLKMGEHLVVIAELPGGWYEDLEIRGITCTHTDGVRGLVITALRKLEGSNAPLVLNSPHFTEKPYSDTGDPDMGIFTEACGDDLKALEALVLKYVDGEREQLELQFSAPAAHKVAPLHGVQPVREVNF